MQCLSSVVLLLNDKKRSIQTLPKPDILCQHIQKETYCFSKRNFRQEKKKSWTLFALVQYFVPSCASPNMQVKEKERKTASFFHEEKSFPLELKLLPTSLCFVSWRGRHIIQELGTHFQKGEKTERVDSPSRKEILKVSRVWDTPDRRITFL